MTAARRSLLGALGIAAMSIAAGSGAAGAQDAPSAGAVEQARIVSPSGDALAEGASATPFTIELPDGAACDGDSRDENYRVDSYMVPAAVDPLEIVFNGLGPQPQSQGDYASFRHPLYDLIGTNFVSIQTADAEELGDPGLILPIEDFDLDVFSPGHIPPGRYHVGIVCTLMNEVQHAWDAQIDVTVDAGDEPAQIHWRTVGFEPNEGSGSPAPVIAGVVAAAVAVAVALIRTRRRPARTIPQRRKS